LRGNIRGSGIAGLRLAPLIIAIAIAALLPAQTRPPAKIEPGLLQEDFRIFRSALEEGHSGIYRYTPKAEMDRTFDAAAKQVVRPMSALEFYRMLAPVVAEIKCGHTAVLPPRDVQAAMAKTIPLFPFDIEVLDGKVYTLREYMPDEQHLTGLEVREINRVPIERILTAMIAATPGDGDSSTARPWRIGHGGAFPRLLYSVVGIESPFTIEFRDPQSGASHTLRLSGVRGDFRETIAPVRYPRDQKPDSASDLKFLDSGRIAVLTIRQFAGGAGGRFFDDAFEQIQRQMSQNLIIDVRNNSGGADELGKKLFSFLVDQPFRYYDDLVLNAREFSFGRYVQGGGGVIPASMVERGADGRFHNIQHPNWGIQQPSQPHFAGQVLALMNGGSFSTTCEFLSNLHSRKRAAFIGEEAAGGYYGNTSGRVPTVILPNSKIAVRVPLQTYYLAVKGGDARRSILPDVEVKPALTDLLAGTDPVMGKALELARAGKH
jgi:hypothetical protein